MCKDVNLKTISQMLATLNDALGAVISIVADTPQKLVLSFTIAKLLSFRLLTTIVSR